MPFGIEPQYFIGLVFILLCACLWAGSSVLIQFIYSDLSFNSPFFLTYLATSLLALHLPYYHGKEWILHHYFSSDNKAASFPRVHQDYSLHGDGDDSRKLLVSSSHSPTAVTIEVRNTSNNSNKLDDSDRFSVSNQVFEERPLVASDYEVLKLAVIIAPMWFLANCFYNYSLLLTTVSSSTVISNLSAAFTLLFSSFLRLEQASYVKIVGVIICFLGAITTGLADSDSSSNDDNAPHHTISGDIVAILGAAGYGLYTTTIRYLIPEDESSSTSDHTNRDNDHSNNRGYAGGEETKSGDINSIIHANSNNSSNSTAISSSNGNGNSNSNSIGNSNNRKTPAPIVSMHLLLGYVGLVNALLLAPVLGIMFAVRWSGVAGITGTAAGVVCANGIADTVIADYFWARAVLLTSPTVATIGMSITIPIALVTDFLVDNIVPDSWSIFGAFLVIVGFVLVNMTQEQVGRIWDYVKNKWNQTVTSS